VALQVVDLLKQNMGLPDWVFPFAIVLLVIGLPVILATAMLQGRPGSAADVAPAEATPATESQPAPAADADMTPRNLFTWRNALVGGALAVVLLTAVTTAFMYMRNKGIGPVGSLVAKGLLDERSPIILADFVADDAGLSRAATEAFRVDLSQTRIVKVAERSSLEPALERMQVDPNQPLTESVAREVAVREGLKAVIAGEITEAGGSYVLTARVVSAADGIELASHRETARDQTEIIPAIDRLSGKIREKIGESFTSLRSDAPLAAVTTSSLEALELYSEAVEAIEHRGDSEAGIRLLEEALEIDPDFASAWRKLGIQLSNARRERARATEAITRAYELKDRLTQRERYLAEASYFNGIRFDKARAMAAYERMLDLDPNDDWALNNLGLIYGQMGDQERGLELYERSLALDSSSITLGNVMFTQVRLGRFDEAAATAATGRRLFPEDARFHIGDIDVAMNLEDYPTMVAAAEEMIEAFPADLSAQANARSHLAEVTFLQGRLADAEAFERDGRGYLKQMGLPGADYTFGRFWTTLVMRNDTASARALIENMLAEHPLDEIPEPLDRPYLDFDGMYAALGDAEAAQGMIDAFREAVPDAPERRWADNQAHVDGMKALHAGRYDEAIDHFLELRRLEPGCNTCEFYEIGLAHDLAGRADSAFAWYRRDLETPRLRAPARPILFERLAQLYDERGDLENAALYYARFVELWADADDELQPRVETARARLEEIIRERG
ncbi:MAG: tetratricopeptide repeat protein, partial [Gemmatimonadales bacterium]